MDMISQEILDKQIPINDVSLYYKAFDILTEYGNNVKKNDTQIWIALKKFESVLPQSNDESNGLRMRELEDYLDEIWLKKDEKLGRNSGKVAKPFEGIYQDEQGNVWRNPFGTQKGISCFAPKEIITKTDFVEERRTVCKYRIEHNKCEFAPNTTCNPYDYPKLLQITNHSKSPYEYKKTTWTDKMILTLLNNKEKIPLVPLIITIYFGAHHKITKHRQCVTVEEFQNEFNFSIESMISIFDMYSDIGLGKGILPYEDFEEIQISPSKDYARQTEEKNMKENEINKFPSITGRLYTIEQKKNIYYVDEVQLEQANTQHKRIISVFAKFFHDRGITSYEKGRADLIAMDGSHMWLMEMKSITDDNQIKQTRSAIGQLFDYEFLELANYRTTHKILKAIAFEREPSEYIVSLLQYIGIYVFWLTESGEIIGNEQSKDHLNRIGSHG